MASIKAQALASARKLTHTVDGTDVALQINDEDIYVRELVNDDFDRIDEIQDEYSELERQVTDTRRQIDDEDDVEARKRLRAQARELVKEMRALDVQMLALYIENAAGDRFAEDVLAQVPVRIQTLAMNAASRKVMPQDPTTDPNASG